MGTVSLISKDRVASKILTGVGLLPEDMDERIIKPSDVFVQVLALGMSEEEVLGGVGSVRAVSLDLRKAEKAYPNVGEGIGKPWEDTHP